MDMDLEDCKDTMRESHGTQNEGTEGPLEAFAADGHPKELPKNDALDQLSNAPQEKDFVVGKKLQPPSSTFAYKNDTARASLSASQTIRRQSAPSTEIVVIPSALYLTDRDLRLLRTAKRDPPVTKKTLSELDLPRILSNIHLRMDANFDRDLQFKPDFNGETGRRKRKEASKYWEALATEISICAFSASEVGGSQSSGESHSTELHTFEPRLPTLFETLQNVLKTLVPEQDHPSIMQNLDVALLMQQIRKGLLDMIFLAKWLAALLKTHCAPMRDEWADSMVEQITAGFHAQDSRDIVRGLQTMFAILEAMKLDVANYQIRAFRGPLIESTVPFLQEYFRVRIERNYFSLEMSRQWYEELRQRELRHAALQADTDAQQDSFWPMAVMFEGLLDLLLQYRTPEVLPETFIFDAERLWQLRSSLHNMIKLDICWHIFESYVQSQDQSLSHRAETYTTFRARIWSLLLGSDDDDHHHPLRGSTHRWLKYAHNVALEIARFATAACSRDDDKTNDSSSSNLVPDEVISSMETSLMMHLSNKSTLFGELQHVMRKKLSAVTFAYAKKYLTMSPLAICESQRGAPIVQRLTHPHGQTGIDRIGMRLAHMGVLHWRVWGPMLYAQEETADVSSPTMSMADDDPPLLSRICN